MTMTRNEMFSRRSRPEQEKLDRLPRWAYDYITRCERDIEHLERGFERITDSGFKRTNAFSITNVGRTYSFPADHGYHFEWKETGDREGRVMRLMDDRAGSGIKVMADEMISIEPQASNTVIIRFVRD